MSSFRSMRLQTLFPIVAGLELASRQIAGSKYSFVYLRNVYLTSPGNSLLNRNVQTGTEYAKSNQNSDLIVKLPRPAVQILPSWYTKFCSNVPINKTCKCCWYLDVFLTNVSDSVRRSRNLI